MCSCTDGKNESILMVIDVYKYRTHTHIYIYICILIHLCSHDYIFVVTCII